MNPQSKKTGWKAKYQGQWHLVTDVEDSGEQGKQNIYHLEDVGAVEQSEIEDLDLAAASLKDLEVISKLFGV